MKQLQTRISIDEARQIDMLDYLSQLGYAAAKVRGINYWYLSPLREEKTPSFKINRKLNCWYDHSIGKGGNLIDFAILFYNCTVGEFLKELGGNFSFHKPTFITLKQDEDDIKSAIEIVNEKAISSLALERYLTHRRIPVDLAKEYCKEVTYKLYDKEYYSIGFKNNAGGYELRNQYYKASTAPKDIKTYKNCNEEALVFEGFF